MPTPPPPPPPSPAVALANAVAAAIAAQTWTPTVTVTSRRLPLLDLQNLSGVQVSVIPDDRDTTTEDADRHAIKITIDVQAKLTKDPNADTSEFDPLTALCSGIADFLRNKYQGDAFCRQTADGYDKAELYKYQEFWGYVNCTFETQYDFSG